MLKQTAILLMALAIFAANHPADAQQPGKVPVVGFLLGSSERVHGIYVDQLRQGLKEAGYVDGHDIVLEYRFASGKPSLAREQAAEFVRRRVDVIVAVGAPPMRFAAEATKTIPIVVAYASGLLDSGLVASMARPEGNVTGMTVLTQELAPKRLQLLIEAVPEVSRVALLFSPTKSSLAAVAHTRSAAKQLGVTVQEVQVRGPDDFASAFAAMAQQHASAVIMVTGRIISLHRRQLIELAVARKLPTICWRPALVRNGCLMSYGADRSHMVHRAAGYVAKILRGAKPADLPVERPSKFVLAVNLKTAKALGITIPQSIMLLATKVIE